MVRRYILRLEVNLRDAPVVAGDEAVEDLGEPHARAPVDPTHDAEVDRGDPPVLQREQVPMVEVGVKKTVDHRLAKEGADENGAEHIAIVTRGDQRFTIVELDAVQPF